MHTLYCTPLGETMRDEFTRSLVDAVVAGKGRERAYLLPSAYLLNATRQAIRAMGRPGFEPPKLLSFDELVEEIAWSAGCRYRRMNRMTQELLVARVLDELKAAGELPYFSSIAAFPGYVSTVTSLLAEIKRTGTTPEEFAAVAEARDWLAKDREVYAIYTAYQEQLSELGLADLEETYFLAINALQDENTVLPYRHLYISEFYILTPLQLELVKNLRSRVSMDIAIIYEKNRTEVFASVEQTYAALVGMDFTPRFTPKRRRTAESLAHIRDNLFAAEGRIAAVADGVEFISSPNRDKEMAVVAAKIKKMLLEDYCHPREIAVVVRDTSVYAGFRQVCADFCIPVSLPWEEGLADQPLVRLLDNAVTAKLDNGSRHSVLNLVKSPLIATALTIDADALEEQSLNMLIRSWWDWRDLELPEQERQGFAKLNRMVNALPDSGTCAELSDAMKKFIAALEFPGTLGGAYRAGEISPALLKAGLLTYDKIAVADGLLDEMEQGFAMLGKTDEVLELREFAKLFRQVVAGETVRLKDYNSEGVQLVSPAGVRGTAFQAVFILGLTDGEFPLRARENWLYDDRDRGMFNDLGLNIMTAAFRRTEEDLYFAVAAALADESLTVSCHEDAETMPSPYVEEILRLFAVDAVRSEKYSVGDMFPADYGDIYAAKELAGRSLLDIYGNSRPEAAAPAIAEYVFANLVDSDFLRRVTAEGERAAGNSAYAGTINTTWQEGGEQSEFSITALEEYAKCPFAYYARRILKLGEWAEKEEEVGFDVIGTIYHEALAAFLRAHVGEKLRPEELGNYYAELVTLLQPIYVSLTSAKKIVAGKLWDYQRQRLEQALYRWLEFEIGEQNRDGVAFRPEYLEWGFGLPVRPGMDGASVTKPLIVDGDSGPVRIVGKVDRIDRAGDKFAVLDYKRKRCPQFRELEQGVDLQAALYIMAVEQLICPQDGQVAGGGYYSIEALEKEGGMWRAELADAVGHRASKKKGNLSADEWADLQDAVRRQVHYYVEGIRAGRFPAQPVGECPPYCVAREVCRYQKTQNQANQAGGGNNG